MSNRQRIVRLMPSPLTAEQSAKVRQAHRTLLPLLGDPKGVRLLLDDPQGPAPLDLPPQALDLIAQVLSALGDCRSMLLIPDRTDYSVAEAADFLGVSPAFVQQQLDQGHLPGRDVDGQTMIAFADLDTYEHVLRAKQTQALQDMSDASRDLGLDY